MIDSKMVELLRYNGLPHLYGKVETNIDRIMGVLRWVVVEMEHRYRLLEGAKARDLDSYNRKLARREDGKPLPRIVVIIDELADLMMSSPDQTEHNLVRLAQMARATGIHLVVATQRPSTDVVTGLIKANFPARLAFAVSSGVDSRVILDATGAETLLGRGDMLFLNPEVGNPMRAQGVMVTDQEIEKLITHWQKVSNLALDDEPPWEKVLQESAEDGEDDLLEEAISLVQSTQRASASLLQRRLRIGYPRAARLLDQLEEMGIVGPSQGGGRERDVLLDPEDDDYEDD
jgi:S-DNA-T family DNA segregation ATPase FtsK/SpoIIIE